MSPVTSPLDVLIIGAGQAGLAMGHELKSAGLRFLLVDQHQRVGNSWRKRFDSLVLFTPRAYSALPGLPVPGNPDGYPTKDELADYLESYARHFLLPIEMNTGIARLERVNGVFHATTTSGRVITARSVVLATGAFQQPVVPTMARQLAPEVEQLTPESYRNPRQIRMGTVLVVGDGATGRQIALELNESHRVILATGRPRRVSKDRVLGKSIFWWMDKFGVIRMPRTSRVGQKLMLADPFPGKHLELERLRAQSITVVGRLNKAAGRRVEFESGEAAEIDTVIWATGYRDRTDWVEIPGAVDAQGAFVQERGISPVPNLYLIGRSWQWSRGSALVTGVRADAEYVARHLLGALGQVSQAQVAVEAPGPVAVSAT